MYRVTCALALLVMVATATGCTMCAHPFDYCGSTFTGGCGEQCIANTRAGSVCSNPTGCTTCGHPLAAGEVDAAPQDEQLIATPLGSGRR